MSLIDLATSPQDIIRALRTTGTAQAITVHVGARALPFRLGIGQTIRFVAPVTNTGADVTVAIGVDTLVLRGRDGSPIAAGALPGGALVEAIRHPGGDLRLTGTGSDVAELRNDLHGLAADTGNMTESERTKLSLIEAEATKNATDAFLLSRANHTGTQSAETVRGAYFVGADEFDIVALAHDAMPPSISAAVQNAQNLQTAIDMTSAAGVALTLPDGVIWVAGYHIRKTGLMMLGVDSPGGSVIKMHPAVHRDMPLSVSSVRGTIQKKIHVSNVTFDFNVDRYDEVAQAAAYPGQVITFTDAERLAAFGVATTALRRSNLIISDQNDVVGTGEWSTYANVRAIGGESHALDVTAPSSMSDADKTALGLPTGTATAYDPQPARGIRLIRPYATGGSDDNITTHYCSFVEIHDPVSIMSRGARVPGNSNAIEIDDGSRNIKVFGGTTKGCDGGLQIKGHNYAPAPYNVLVDGLTIINARYGVELRHTGFYGTGSDGEDLPPVEDEEGNLITLTGVSATARNVQLDNITVIALREYETGGVMRAAERGLRVRSYENVQISNMLISDGAVDLQKITDGYQAATTLNGPVVQINGGASNVQVKNLNTRGYKTAPYGVRIYSTSGPGIIFDGLDMIDAPLAPWYVSGDPGSSIALSNYRIQGDWLGTPASTAIRFSGPNFGGLGFGTVDGYNIKSTAPTLGSSNADDVFAVKGPVIAGGDIRVRRTARSTGNASTTPQDGLRLGWEEPDGRDIGAGEGVAAVWTAKLFGDAAPVPIGKIEMRKIDSSDASRQSSWHLMVSSDGTELGLRDVLSADPATGRIVTPFGIQGIPVALHADGVAVVTTGTTAQTTVKTKAVPAASIGPNGWLDIDVEFTMNSSTTNKVVTIEFGGVVIHQTSADALDSTRNYRQQLRVQNRNSQSSQYFRATGAASPVGASASTGATTAAVDTTLAQDVVVKVQLESGADTIVCERITVQAVYMP